LPGVTRQPGSCSSAASPCQQSALWTFAGKTKQILAGYQAFGVSS